MSAQSLALLVSFCFLLLLSIAFLWVVRRSAGNASLEQVSVPAYRLRARLFAVVTIAGVVVAAATLAPWPHDARAGQANQTIQISARQWAWELSSDRARVGDVVEFVVTSQDVTHGFALYDPNRRIVAQIQAMPGFVNTVRHHFTEPGKYEVLCLEFCGLAHHAMVAEIQVQAKDPK